METTQQAVVNAEENAEGSQQKVFTVLDLLSLAKQDQVTYANEIKKLHRALVKDDVSSYFETQVQLPRPLKKRATATTSKIIALNPELKQNDWSKATAEVSGNKLFLTTFSKRGKQLLTGLEELNSGGGMKLKVPEPCKPQNQFYVSLLLLKDWDTHTISLGAPLQMFRTAERIENPHRNNPLGYKRLFRLSFSTVTAPREVFTKEDPLTPIQEVITKSGAMTRVNHKWNRLNAYPLPSLITK